MNVTAYDRAVQAKLIDPCFHGPLLRNAERILREANIPLAGLFQSMHAVCSKDEVDYFTAIQRQSAAGVYGMVIHGPRPTHTPMDRCVALVGACLRNYIDARLMTLQTVLELLDAGALPAPTLLAIPNFFVNTKDGGKLAEWQPPRLLGMLYDRQAAGLQTVVYVQEWPGLENAYGSACAQHLGSEHFRKVDAEFDNK